MIAEIACQLIADAGFGTPGTDLFAFRAPEERDTCILVLEDLTGIAIDENLPGYIKGPFKIIVRNPDHQSAVTIASLVGAALNLHRQTVNGFYVVRMRQTATPITYPTPSSDVIEVSVDMWAVVVTP